MKSKILVVAAHPDDEILGCGGTMARLVKEGSEVYTLILGTGITSRYENNEEVEIKDKLKLLKCHAHEANKLIGVNEVITDDFPDNAFDTVALLDIVKSVEKVKDKIKPGLIFTHYEKDLNIDHKITYEAVITAARPMPGETVRQIYSFEVPSSTEWRYPLSFTPDTFYDVGNTIEIKCGNIKIKCPTEQFLSCSIKKYDWNRFWIGNYQEQERTQRNDNFLQPHLNYTDNKYH